MAVQAQSRPAETADSAAADLAFAALVTRENTPSPPPPLPEPSLPALRESTSKAVGTPVSMPEIGQRATMNVSSVLNASPVEETSWAQSPPARLDPELPGRPGLPAD